MNSEKRPHAESTDGDSGKQRRTVPVMSSFERAAVERRRLQRVVEKLSREPTKEELKKLEVMVKKVHPDKRAGQLFVGMHAVTLTKATLDQIDLKGFFTLKADGIHALMARVNTDQRALARSRAAREEAARRRREEPAPEVPVGKRHDTMLFVTRDDKVRAIDRVFVHFAHKQLLLDGELCLRKRKLTQDELYRLGNGFNVHDASYLEYYTYADAEAIDRKALMSDRHQQRYDEHFQLVYAAFDCLLVKERQLSDPYSDRLTMLRDLTETPLAQSRQQAFQRQVEALQAGAHYAGGADKFVMPVFAKPTLAVRDVRAGMHAVPRAMYGIQTDGVIFNPDASNYVPGFNQRLLKFKTTHTADLVVRRAGSRYELCAQQRAKLTPVSNNLLIDSKSAEELLLQHANGKDVLECEGVRTGHDNTSIAWRPVLWRSEKPLPNSVRNYRNVVEAIVPVLDEETVLSDLERRLRAERQRQRPQGGTFILP